MIGFIRKSRWRYVLPNAVTASGIFFGFLAVQEAIVGHPRGAAWWALYCVLADKADGFVARAVHATSEFGMQLDSLADFLSFGIAPAAIFYSFFATVPEAGWASGAPLFALRCIVAGYVICAASRLARFNVIADVKGGDKFFFGVPTTLTGGILGSLFLMGMKYAAAPLSTRDPVVPYDFHPLARFHLEAGFTSFMRIFPILIALGAIGMVSTLRVPKFGKSKSTLLNIWFVGNVLFGYTFGLARMLPEWLSVCGVTYMIGTFAYHLMHEEARAIQPPKLFT